MFIQCCENREVYKKNKIVLFCADLHWRSCWWRTCEQQGIGRRVFSVYIFLSYFLLCLKKYNNILLMMILSFTIVNFLMWKSNIVSIQKLAYVADFFYNFIFWILTLKKLYHSFNKYNTCFGKPRQLRSSTFSFYLQTLFFDTNWKKCAL